ncbi:MAG: thiamine phosphate synthase, partial [Polyangiaceae bacterium]
SARDTVALLEALRSLCNAAGVPLVANDRVDLALATKCDLVHLGQDDASADVARAVAPMLGVGLSTHTPDQLSRALKSRPTYVAYGPVFATASKRNHEPPVGLEGLAAARKIISESGAPTTPLVAIGGISAENAAAVRVHADVIAVIGALIGSDPGANLRALQTAAGDRA